MLVGGGLLLLKPSFPFSLLFLFNLHIPFLNSFFSFFLFFLEITSALGECWLLTES